MKRTSPRTFLPTVAALIGASLGCRGSQRLVHFPAPRREFVSVAYETRPGCWLSAGDSIEWDLPPGPSRRLEGGYASALAGLPAAGLEIILRSAGSREDRVARIAITPDPLRWGHWSAKLPRTAAPSVLRIAFQGPPSASGFLRSLFLTEPTVSIGRREQPRTIVLFVVDTLRADHVSGYGYGRPTTPRIDRFFRDGLRARVCIPAANWTLPSHASLLTSSSVARHGVGRYGQFLPDALDTLAEVLRRVGYRTLAVTGGGYVDPVFGFSRGFDRYAVLAHPADDTVDEALTMISDYPDEPVFLFLHTYQVHDYSPDEEDAREIFPDLSALGPGWKAGGGPLTPEQRSDPRAMTWRRNRYDAALRSVDGAFGRILEGLSRAGRLDRTAFVFTSDHGEQLCDRLIKTDCLAWSHGSPYLYEEELRVPLEIRVPWLPKARGEIRELTTLLDVAPTIAAAAGAPVPASFEGSSLLSGAAPSGRLVATEAPPLEAFAVREGDVKLIRRAGTRQISWIDGNPFATLPAEDCFDLARDPGETHRAGCSEDERLRLRERADRYLASSFSDSLVVRVPAGSPGAGEAVVRARGRAAAPLLRTFGLASRNAIENFGPAAEARFASGPAPVWLAFQPTDGSRALEIEVSGLSSLLSAQGDALPDRSLAWDGLEWASGRALPRGIALFTTPRSTVSASSLAVPSDVVARLLALGYLRGSPVPPPRPNPASQGGGGGANVEPGEVRVRHAN